MTDRMSPARWSWVSELFTVPLIDLGVQEQALSGVLMPLLEFGTKKVGITDQFLGGGAEYHRKYSNVEHFSSLIGRALDAAGRPHQIRLALDVGSGSGVNTVVPLLKMAPECRIVATDLSPNLLRMLREYLCAEGLQDKVACICTDAMRTFFRPERFDLVLGAAILHHLLDPVAALLASRRTLKPGGIAIWFEPFEPGLGVVRLLYSLILREAERNCRALPEAVEGVLNALVADTAARSGTDKSAPHFREMDDKWLFTRRYIEEAATRSGFESVALRTHSAHGRLFRDLVAVQLRLAADLPPEALPPWAWDLVELADQCFSDDAKADIPHEATIILRKAP